MLDDASASLTRAFTDDGYLYVISKDWFKVVGIDK